MDGQTNIWKGKNYHRSGPLKIVDKIQVMPIMLCPPFNSSKCMILLWESVCFILFSFTEWIGKLCFRPFALVHSNCDGKLLTCFLKSLDLPFLGSTKSRLDSHSLFSLTSRSENVKLPQNWNSRKTCKDSLI